MWLLKDFWFCRLLGTAASLTLCPQWSFLGSSWAYLLLLVGVIKDMFASYDQ